MNKIQLYITKSTRTFKSMVNINPEEDVRAAVTDVRTYLEKVDYDAAEKNIFYLLKSTASGTFVTVLRTPYPPISATIWPRGYFSHPRSTSRLRMLSK